MLTPSSRKIIKNAHVLCHFHDLYNYFKQHFTQIIKYLNQIISESKLYNLRICKHFTLLSLSESFICTF